MIATFFAAEILLTSDSFIFLSGEITFKAEFFFKPFIGEAVYIDFYIGFYLPEKSSLFLSSSFSELSPSFEL